MEEELPQGWADCNVGDVALLIRGVSYQKSDASKQPQEGYSALLRANNINERINRDELVFVRQKKISLEQWLKVGDVLIAMSSGSKSLVGKAAQVRTPQREAFGAFCGAVRPSPEIDAPFFGWFFQTRKYREGVSANAKGSNINNLKRDHVISVPFRLPPLNEQRRIVEKIETLFAELDKGEEAIRAVQTLLKRYRQSVLKAAVTGALTAEWRAENAGKLEHGRDLLARILKARREQWTGRGKYTEPVAPDATDLPELPEGWVWSSLDQLLAHLTSGSRDWKKYYGRGDGVFIMAQNVRPMRFDLSEKFIVDPPPTSPDAIRSEVEENDLLITIVGANTGDVCRFPLSERKHYVCQSVALLRLVDTGLAAFVEMYLAGKGAGRDLLEEFIYGAGRPHLSFEQLRSIQIPLPSAQEQIEIVALMETELDRLQQVEAVCELELRRSAALRQSILKQAFAGKLVPQDPDDEPASELLARIRAERADKPKAKRGRARA